MARMNPRQQFELYTYLAYKTNPKKSWVQENVLPVVLERIEADLPTHNLLQTIIADNAKLLREKMVGKEF